MLKDTLQMLVDSTAITTNDFEVIGVDETGFDFKDNELWKAAKNESTKAYKKLKEIEFNLIHK